MPYISRLKLHNVKNFRSAAVDLRPLTVFIGANNSGKSTIFRFLKLAGELCTLGLQKLPEGSRAGWLAQGAVEPVLGFSLSVEDLLPGRTLQYTLRLGGVAPRTALRIVAEELVELTPEGESIVHSRRGEGDSHLQLFRGTQRVEDPAPDPITANGARYGEPFGQLGRFLGGIECYSFQAASLREPSEVNSNTTLGPHGERIAAVVDELASTHPEAFEGLQQDLRSCVKEVDRLLTPAVAKGKKQLAVREIGHSDPFLADQMSDGLLLTIALLTLVHLPDPPSVICLEEPENGIHPRRLTDILHLLVALAYPGASQRPTQVLLTTHSPYLIDQFRDRLDELIVVERDDAGSRLVPLSEASRSGLEASDLTLGELWYEGSLGGVPR